MANTYIEVPADAIEDLLAGKNPFEVDRTGNEVVYVRRSSKQPALQLKVYSSVAVGQGAVRAKDTDAIRVVLLADVGANRRPYVLFKQKILRVNSVEGVLLRIRDACRAASKEADQYLRTCPKCGAPAYSDSGACLVKACREAQRKTPKGELHLDMVQAALRQVKERANAK